MRITIDITAEEVREVMCMDDVPVLAGELRERLIACLQEIDEFLSDDQPVRFGREE